CLAIFSISIAIGSGLAAWLAAGRIILLPTVIGAVLLGLAAIDLGFSPLRGAPGRSLDGYFAIFSSPRGLHLALDLAFPAAAGGLFIVPTFAAVQAWAGADCRARVVAPVNVRNAAFMGSSTVIVAMLQTVGMTASQLFILLGAASLVVAVAVGRTMPASALSDALSILYRALFRMEVKGIDNLNTAASNRIIALNHVSFLDAGLALSLLNNKPVFAIDVGIAQLWWVRPFVKLTNAMKLDPLKPMAVRSLIEAVKAGNPLIIFPEGRITVTGNLMKGYDGAALIADKTNAEIVPVRIEGLEQTPFSRLKRAQVRRRWFPKVTVTILEPVRLTVDPELKGRKRRLAAGAALYGIMSDLVFRTTSTDRTMVQAVLQTARTPWRRPHRHRSPGPRPAPLQAPPRRRRHPGRQAHAIGAGGPRDRRHAAERERRRRRHSGADDGWPRAGDDQLHRRRGKHPFRLHGSADRHHRFIADFHREGSAAQLGCRDREGGEDRLSRGHPRPYHARRQAPRPPQCQQAPPRAQA